MKEKKRQILNMSQTSENLQKTLKQRIFRNKCLQNGEKLYLKSKYADVHFLVGENMSTATRIPATKAILAADCPAFDAMLFGDLKQPGDVHIPDSSDSAFMEFLQYFYLIEVKLTEENIVGVLYLGEKYGVEKCVNDCVQFLMDTTDDENVCERLDLAILFDKMELLGVCEKRIMLNTKAVLESEGFLESEMKVLSYILKIDGFSCSEYDVFRACMSWVKSKSDRDEVSFELVQQYLGDLYYEIRVASLTTDQLHSLEIEFPEVLKNDALTISFILVLPEFELCTKFKKCSRKTVQQRSA